MNSAALASGWPREQAARRLAVLSRASLYVHAAFLPISIAGMQIGLFASALATVAAAALGARPTWKSPLLLPALAMCAAAALSQLIAFSWVGGPVNAVLWRSFLSPLIVLAALSLEPERMRRSALELLALWAAFALVPAGLAWVQVRTGFDPMFAMGLRKQPIVAKVPGYAGHFAAMGFFTWYQRLAQNLTPPLLLLAALTVLYPVPRRFRIAAAAACVAIAAAVVLTFARAAWYGLVVGAVVIALYARPARALAGSAAAAGALLLLYLVNPGVRSRISTSLSASGNGDRMQIWNVCRTLLEEHPLRGYGFGNLPVAARATWWRLYPVGTVRAWCHDQFLSSWVEGGPLLFFATLYWFAGTALAMRNLGRRSDALGRAASAGAMAGLAAFAVNALVHDVFYSSEPMFGMGFALGLAAVLAEGPR